MIANFPPYILKRNSRSRNLRISVRAGGEVLVSAPLFVSDVRIEQFLKDRSSWIEKYVEKYKKIPKVHRLTASQEKKLFVLHKARAYELAKEKVENFNRYFGFPVGKIMIRNSKTRWGSCSSKRTLSFNYKIAFLPEHLADYLVVHELCHLKEANHRKTFWALMAQKIPEYKMHRRELRGFELTFPLTSVGV
ncbi:MAG: SprT family zinc-dependent metalloprotease [Patescibacteria group bacterium]